MTGLNAGTTLYALDFPPYAYASELTAHSNLSSTSYAAGSPACDVTFMAPTTGRVMVTVGIMGRDDGGDNRIYLAPQVYLGTDATGTLVLSPGVQENGCSTMGEASDYMSTERSSVLSGLEPGETYYVRTMHRVTGGTTADLLARTLIVRPLS